jgi:hypothetical protein
VHALLPHHTFQRDRPLRAPGLGVWNRLFDALTLAAMLSNAMLMSQLLTQVRVRVRVRVRARDRDRDRVRIRRHAHVSCRSCSHRLTPNL